MLEENKNRNSKNKKNHLVLICDETGIFDAFNVLKENLGGRKEFFLSLIYTIPEKYSNTLFEREIAILEKRFSHNLYIRILKVEPGKYDSIQEYIEAIINSSTESEMQFQIFGNVMFVDFVYKVLRYLNVDTFSIK